MIIVRRRDPSFSGYSDVSVIVNGSKVTKLGYNSEQQFLLSPGSYNIYFKRSLSAQSNPVAIDVYSENDIIIIECYFNNMATSLSAYVVSVQRAINNQEQAPLQTTYSVHEHNPVQYSHPQYCAPQYSQPPQQQKKRSSGCLVVICIVLLVILLLSTSFCSDFITGFNYGYNATSGR